MSLNYVYYTTGIISYMQYTLCALHPRCITHHVPPAPSYVYYTPQALQATCNTHYVCYTLGALRAGHIILDVHYTLGAFYTRCSIRVVRGRGQEAERGDKERYSCLQGARNLVPEKQPTHTDQITPACPEGLLLLSYTLKNQEVFHRG